MMITIDVDRPGALCWTQPCRVSHPARQAACTHSFLLGLYVPPGQTIDVTCPYCGAVVPIHGNGPTC